MSRHLTDRFSANVCTTVRNYAELNGRHPERCIGEIPSALISARILAPPFDTSDSA